MPNYTTSYSTKKKPHYRRNNTNQLPGGRRRQVKKPGVQYLHHSQGFGRRAGRGSFGGNSRRPYAFIAVGCAFLLFVATIIWYANRDVEISLNGGTVKARINSSIEQLIVDQELEPSPGKLLAVDDSVLDKHGGEAVSVKLNGKRVAAGDLGETELQPGDEVEVEDGRDRYEEHDVQATEIAPKVTLQGTGALTYVKTWGVPGRSEVWTGKTSGKTHDRGVVSEVQDCQLVRRSVSPDAKGKRYVSLTFDEGPSAKTEAILKVLEEKGVKATFFLDGDAVEKYPDAVKAIADAGHAIGSNTAGDESLEGMPKDELRAKLDAGFKGIKKASGAETALLRAPFGVFTEQNWADSMDLVSVAVTWNVDSGDWMLQGAQAVADTVVDSVSNGNIVLLTDNNATAEQTVEALPILIDALREKGYEIVGLPELIATDEDLSEDLKSLTSVKMPKGASLPQIKADEDGASGE